MPEENTSGGAGADSGDGVLARRFRGLSFDGFLGMMTNIYGILHKLLFRISCYDSVLLNVFKKISIDPKMSQKWPVINSGKEQLAEVVYAAFDLVHTRCGKMLTLKNEQLSQLNSKVPLLYLLYYIVSNFYCRISIEFTRSPRLLWRRRNSMSESA